MLDDPISVEQFCRRFVEPMGEESDHIHIVAITDALQVRPCLPSYATSIPQSSAHKPCSYISAFDCSPLVMACGSISQPASMLVQIPITVVYLDRSMAAFTGHSADDAAVNLHNFVPEAMQNKAGAVVKPRIHLLYRPGHYDILYPKAAA